MSRVDGKVALVSGGARGIGAETARTLAAAGASVVITDRLEKEGAETVAAIEAAGGKALFLTHDVTSEAQWERVVQQAADRFGGLHILVNNAGVYRTARIEEMTLEDWRFISAVNLEGVFLGTKHAVRVMKETIGKTTGTGSIINLSSVAGLIGSPFTSAYSMSKGGVRLFTKSAALEFAQLGYRIRVNSVHPGVIQSDMAEQVVEKFVALGTGEEAQVRQNLIKLHPLGRMGAPADIAKAILFLASDDSDFITGAELVVDGGWTAR